MTRQNYRRLGCGIMVVTMLVSTIGIAFMTSYFINNVLH